MKKSICIIFFSIFIFSNGFSSENDEKYNFLYNLLNDFYYIRESCIMYTLGVLNKYYLQLIENEINFSLLNIILSINDKKILFDNNELLKRIINIINYEINKFINMDFKNNSYELINRIDLIIEILFSGIIINSYEDIIIN